MEDRWIHEVLSDARKNQQKSKAGSTSTSTIANNGNYSSSLARSRLSNVISPSSVLPNSVRNAPQDMRAAIRRKQNADVR